MMHIRDDDSNDFMTSMGSHHSYDSHNNPLGLSKAELRKNNKPIMEKKRRARINHCLNELKTLILDALKKDPARHTKLEKADILEMTVKHLQTVQRSQSNHASHGDVNVLHKFKAGFADCTDEVSRYINQIDGVETSVKQRLIGHLSNCVGGLQQVVPATPFTYGTPSPYQSNTFVGSPQPLQPISAQDLNNNGGRINMGGVQLIPSRLPTGELALVMPNSSNLPYFPTATFPASATTAASTNAIDLNTATFPRISAFNSVQKPVAATAKHQTTSSPPLSPTSSISSGDDFSLPASDFQSQSSQATTPPLQPSPASVFPTPPSAANNGPSLVLHPIAVTTTVQQPQISSTTEPPKTKPLSVITNINHRHQDTTATNNKKRPYPSDGESHPNGTGGGLLQLSTEGTPAKMFKSDAAANLMHHHNEDINGDMWRPW